MTPKEYKELNDLISASVNNTANLAKDLKQATDKLSELYRQNEKIISNQNILDAKLDRLLNQDFNK